MAGLFAPAALCVLAETATVAQHATPVVTREGAGAHVVRAG